VVDPEDDIPTDPDATSDFDARPDSDVPLRPVIAPDQSQFAQQSDALGLSADLAIAIGVLVGDFALHEQAPVQAFEAELRQLFEQHGLAELYELGRDASELDEARVDVLQNAGSSSEDILEALASDENDELEDEAGDGSDEGGPLS